MDTLSLQDYTIYIDNGLKKIASYIEKSHYSKCFVIVDENTVVHCFPLIEKLVPTLVFFPIQILSGENHKTIDTCQKIWQALMEESADRKALVLNLGGGVIGDMGGFCAATFKRGIDFIQIPTTLLSQVDASIGGKLGIDFGRIKNSVGLFKNPQAVFVESEFLKTLPFRELRSGYAEIIKHSLIADGEQWTVLSQILDLRSFVAWSSLITPSLKIKQRIVEEDPFEKGIRKALNFGHTVGHAVESLALESAKPLLHGEAIAIGMICEAYLSHIQSTLSKKELSTISNYLISIYEQYPIKEEDFPALIQLMKNDKKNHNQQINCTLLLSIGTCMIDQVCSEKNIENSLRYYQQLKKSLPK